MSDLLLKEIERHLWRAREFLCRSEQDIAQNPDIAKVEREWVRSEIEHALMILHPYEGTPHDLENE
jgi:hypothetical protein